MVEWSIAGGRRRIGEGQWVGMAGLGHALEREVFMNSNRQLVKGFRIKGFLDWAFVALSFLLFLVLEGALVYAFFVFIDRL